MEAENRLVIGAQSEYDRSVDGSGEAESCTLSAEDWRRDAADYLLNLDDEDMARIRKRVRDILYWNQHMLPNETGWRMTYYSSNVANFAVEIAALLVKSIEASGITREMLEVEQ